MKKLLILVAVLLCGSIQADRRVVWDEPATNTDGTPCTDLDHHLLAITPATEDANGTSVTFSHITRVECIEDCSASLTEAVLGLPEDVYKVWVAAVDKFGNQSRWSEPVEFVHENLPPAAPTNVQIQITVNVTITNP